MANDKRKKIATVQEFETNLSRLVDRVVAGEEVIITRAGEPVAKLEPYSVEAKLRVPGRLRGKLVLFDEFDKADEEIEKLFHDTQESQ